MRTLKTFLVGFFLLTITTTVFAEDFDIAGLKLGMTYDEAKQALLAHDVRPETVQEQLQTFSYTDGAKAHRTEPFLHVVNANKDVREAGGWNQDQFAVYFSPPPEASKVVAIYRVVSYRNNAPTKGQYIESLNEKYGEPKNMNSRLTWWFPEGKMNCGNDVNLVTIPDIDMVMKSIFASNSNRYFLDRFNKKAVTSVDDCAGYLIYQMGMLQPDAPANNVQATMIDVPYWVNANIKSMEWVAQLQKDATAKRLAAGSPKPTL